MWCSQLQYLIIFGPNAQIKKLLAQMLLCRGLKTREHSEIIQRSIINDSIIQIELFGMPCDCLGRDKTFFYSVIKFLLRILF